MPTSDSPAARRRSRVNRVLVWIGIPSAVFVLVVVTFLSVTNHRASMLLQNLRDRGEPVCAADIEFDERIPPSDLHDRALRFRAVAEKVVYVYPDVTDQTDSLAKLDAWPEGRNALPAYREYLDCIRSDPAKTQARREYEYGAKEHAKKPHTWPVPHSPHGWDELLDVCMDPSMVDDMTACERKGIHALEMLKDPCVPAALDLCGLSRETGEQILKSWHPSNGRPGLTDQLGLVNAAWMLSETIPGVLERGDTESAMRRIEAIFHAADSVSGLPWEFGHTAWMRLVSLGLDGCRFVLAAHAPTVDWTPVLRHLDGYDPRANLEHALVGDRALGIEVFEAARSGRIDPDTDLGHTYAEVHAMDLTGGADLSLYLEVMQEGIDLSRKGAWGPTRGKRDWQRGQSEFPLWAEMSWGLLPCMDEMRFRTLGVQADIALARIAITASTQGIDAARQMAAQTLDPFDGKPMRWRVGDHVMTVWSVGADAVDDDASSAEIINEDLKVTKHVFNHRWTAGAGSYREDIVWRVRLR